MVRSCSFRRWLLATLVAGAAGFSVGFFVNTSAAKSAGKGVQFDDGLGEPEQRYQDMPAGPKTTPVFTKLRKKGEAIPLDQAAANATMTKFDVDQARSFAGRNADNIAKAWSNVAGDMVQQAARKAAEYAAGAESAGDLGIH